MAANVEKIQKRKDKQLKSHYMIKRIKKNKSLKKNLEKPTPQITYQKGEYQEFPEVQLVYEKFRFHKKPIKKFKKPKSNVS